jgi:hypothetical protein
MSPQAGFANPSGGRLSSLVSGSLSLVAIRSHRCPQVHTIDRRRARTPILISRSRNVAHRRRHRSMQDGPGRGRWQVGSIVIVLLVARRRSGTSISFLMDPWRRHLFRAVNTVCNMASLPTERIRRIKVFRDKRRTEASLRFRVETVFTALDVPDDANRPARRGKRRAKRPIGLLTSPRGLIDHHGPDIFAVQVVWLLARLERDDGLFSG